MASITINMGGQAVTVDVSDFVMEVKCNKMLAAVLMAGNPNTGTKSTATSGTTR